MAFDPTTVMQTVKTALATSGRVKSASIGAPNAPPATTHGAVWLEGFSPAMPASGMAALSGVLNLNVRLYRPAANEPNETVELEMGRTVFEILEVFCGNFDFGDANVRNFLPGEAEVSVFEAEYKGLLYTLADITVRLLVNDVASFAN